MTEVAAVTETTTAATDAPASFDAWLASQPEEIAKLYDTHVDGLKSALEGERTSRKDLEKQLRQLSKTATEGSELKKQIDEFANNLQLSESRAAFYEEAHSAGVKNLKLAWAAAQTFEAKDRNGNVDFAKLKEAAPELFALPVAKTPPANAGAGAGQQGIVKQDMNAFMRNARR